MFLLLARLSRSFREHDWFTGAVELVLLVIGIFIGFQLDRWNGERLEQKEADEYSLQLLEDLTIELHDVSNMIDYLEQVRTYGATALTAWDDNPAADAETLIVAFYQASNVLPFSSLRGTFDALSNKGLMNLIGGPGFSSRLSAYYGQALNSVLDQSTAYRMEIRGIMPNPVQAAIRDGCSRLVSDELLKEQLINDCDIGVSESAAQKILADITQYPKMKFYLRQTISRDSVSIYVLQTKRKMIEDLRAELKSFQD
jgi:hypothetical protein